MNKRVSNIGTSITRCGRTNRPALRPSGRERLLPVVYAGGMLAIGAALLVAKPRIGNVPAAITNGDGPRRGRWRRAAQVGRDNVGVFAPSNVTDSIGRSLLLGGVALLLSRVLDELSGAEGR